MKQKEGIEEMTVKLPRKLHDCVDKINICVEKVMHSENKLEEDILIEETAQELRSRTLENLNAINSYYLEMQRDFLVQNKLFDESAAKKFNIIYRIINEGIRLRRESHRRPNYPMSTNILQHGMYFTGYKRKNIQNPDSLPKEKRLIQFEKNGYRALTYYNERGQLLSLFDNRVFMGLHKLWEKKGKQQEFSFHDYELLQCINLDINGRTYEMLEESLKTLFATSVIMHEFYLKKEKQHIRTKQSYLMQSRESDIELREDGNVRRRVYNIEFSNFLHKSLKEGYISLISLALLEDLQSDAAQGIYLMMSSIPVNLKGEYDFTVEKICEHIGIEKDQRPARLKSVIAKACEQLCNTSILQDVSFYKDENKELHVQLKPSDWFALYAGSIESKPFDQQQLNLFD